MSICPVVGFMARPEPELIDPPVVPVIVGVGSESDLQYSDAV